MADDSRNACAMNEFLIKEFKSYIPEHHDDRFWGIWVIDSGSTGVPAHYLNYPASTHPAGYHYSWEQGRIFRDEYQILYITRGRGIFESHLTGKLNIQEGSILILFPNVWHRYRPLRSTGWDAFWVGVKGDILDRLAENGILSPKKPILNVGVNEALVQEYIQINTLSELQLFGFRPLLSAGAMKILSAVLAIQPRQENNNRHFAGMIQKARLRMIEHADKPLNVQDMARDLHLSYAYFRRLFKRYTGFAPNQYLLEARLNRAKELLRNTQLPLKQISEMLGFDDPFHFSRFFKNRIGLSPRQWRQREEFKVV